MDITKDYYGALGVSPMASLTDIRQAYRVLAVRWHPDMHIGESPEEIRIAEDCFKRVNEAYSVLSDPVQRSEYDYFRASAYSSYSQATQLKGESIWTTILRGFAIAAAVMFYVVFPKSLVSGYWDTDAAARDIKRKVEMEKQTVLMQVAGWKDVQLHTVDIPEIVLPKMYQDAFGGEMGYATYDFELDR